MPWTCDVSIVLILVRWCFTGVMSTTCILHMQWYAGSPQSGVGVGALAGGHGGGRRGGAAAHRGNPRTATVDMGGGSVGTFV
jgi:hypothetical protein